MGFNSGFKGLNNDVMQMGLMFH